MVLMPFQVIRSPGFTYNFFQVILITLGLTFQNLAVDKTNNCKIPLSKLPVRVWLMTSSLVQGQIIWCFKGHSSQRFRSTKIISGLKVCLTLICSQLTSLTLWYVYLIDLIRPQNLGKAFKSFTFYGVLNPYFILFRCIF